MDIGQKQNKNIFPTSIYTFSAEELNQIVNELQHIIDTAGLTRDASDSTQVLQALRLIFSGLESLTGIYVPYGGDILPQGWLWCDGSALSRVDYSGLFARIGTTFGSGDGSNTFNIPDFTGGRFIEGDSLGGVYKNAGLPNIKGRSSMPASNYAGYPASSIATGAFSAGSQFYSNTRSGEDVQHFYVNFNAHNSNSIYSDSVSTVQPKSLSSRWIIKY